jgi:nucleoside phosphorylase
MITLQMGIASTSANGTAISEQIDLNSIFGSDIVGLTLSGVIAVIATYLVQTYLAKPRIKIVIFNMSTGILSFNQKPEYALFTIYVYITNQHHNAVHILDYELNIDFGEGFTRLKRIYQIHQGWPDPYRTETDTDFVEIPDFTKKLIYANPRPVSYGDILKGFVAFGGDTTLHGRKARRIRFTCIDAFQKRHTVVTTPEKYLEPLLFYEFVGAKTTQKV